MTCKLCGGLGVAHGNPLTGTVYPVCGGTGVTDNMSTPAEKTLLDEFAMAAPDRVFSEGHHGMAAFASSAYCYATAMMQERNRRDEMGNVKEANT